MSAAERARRGRDRDGDSARAGRAEPLDGDAARAVERAVRAHAGPWRGDDPLVADAGVEVLALTPRAARPGVQYGTFECAGDVELRCGGMHFETLPARYRGRIEGRIAVVTSAWIGEDGRD